MLSIKKTSGVFFNNHNTIFVRKLNLIVIKGANTHKWRTPVIKTQAATI